MNLANTLTLLRIILAPVFFVIYLLPKFFPSIFSGGCSCGGLSITDWTVPVLWIVFIVSEITDYFDGLAARKLKLTSDFGKLFDPFADTLMQITCLLCFIIDDIYSAGIVPAILFLLVIYREFGILFIRNLMLKKGITLGARIGGKIKTVLYITAIGAALLVSSFERLYIYRDILPFLRTGAFMIFVISVIAAAASFIDYYIIYRKTEKNRQEG